MTGRQWSITTRLITSLIVLTFLFLLAYEIRSLVTPLVLAGLLAYTLNLAVVFLTKRTRVRPKIAANLVYFIFVAITIATPSTLVPVAVRQARTLTSEFNLVIEHIESFLQTPINILGRTFILADLGSSLTTIPTDLDSAFDGALTLVEATSVSLVRLVIILVVSYYLMLDWNGLKSWLLGILPPSGRSDAERLLGEIDRVWRAYMQGTLALMFIMGVVFIIIGFAIGLPGALIVGLLTGVLSMVPELGPWISGVVAVIIALISGSNFLPLSNFWFAVLVAAIYAVISQIKSIWLRPQVMGRFMHMNTGVVFLAIIAAVLLQGILAALVILPILASIGLIGRYIRARLLDIDPWPDLNSPGKAEIIQVESNVADQQELAVNADQE